MSPSATIDRVVRWLKWPVAIACLVFLPGVFYALSFVARDVAQRPATLAPLLAGAAAFVVVWRVLLLPKASRHAVVTLEHELTHAVFALVTLHRVTALRTTLAAGGHVRYAGRGNWLVTIAPYVVPLFACAVAAASQWLDAPRAFSGLFGATLAWNVIANWAPSHRHHGDHREVGAVFAFVVIACANALVLGLALAYATGAHSLTAHLAHVRGPAAAVFSWLIHWISPG
jgi:hypothetical protein